ncbi:MAG: hypothetical protein QNK24_02845 [Desulfuromusa sp.]|nr:hypothetical protein [Desulfuromusa sp.]
MKIFGQVKAVSFVAQSGTGKTTLVEKLVVELWVRGESLLCCGGGYNPSYIAVASDGQLDLEIPVLNLNDPV